MKKNKNLQAQISKHWNELDKIFIGILIFISIFVCKALLKDGFFTSHDGHHQLIRQAVFHQGLVDGQFPVRWAGNAYEGSGYPLFIFTYRLPFWIGEIFYLLVNNLSYAIKLSFIFSLTISAITMYFFLKALAKNKTAAFFGSLLYLFAPYRFVDIFVRAALGEAFCFIFIPLIFWSLYELSFSIKSKSKWIILFAVSLSGLILSHVMTLMIFIPAFTGWFLLCFIFTKSKTKYFLNIFIGGLLSVLLTAYYWLPAFTEKKLTQFNSAIDSYYHFHFLEFKQLFYSKWGFGFSMPGTADDMMSFQLGIAQWLILVSAIISIMIYFVRKNKIVQKYLSFDFKKLLISIYSLSFVLFSIILMLPLGDFFFKNTQKFMSIDIPWKFLSVCVFLIPIIFSIIIISFKNNILKYLFISGILIIAFYGNRNHLSINETIYYPDQELFDSYDTSNQHNDYAPVDFARIDKPEILAKLQKNQLLFHEGEGLLKLLERKSNFLEFSADVVSPNAKIIVNVTRYPGWQLFIDNKQQSTMDQLWGRIIVPLENGSHQVKLVFQDTPLRKTGNYISLVSFIFLCLFYIWQNQKLIQK